MNADASPVLDPKRRAELERCLEGLGAVLDEIDPEIRRRLELRARRPDARLSVGRYLVVGELGRGGMGVVYEAWDPGIERKVAIKTLEPELVPEEEREEVVARFRRETKIIGRLEHPSIVTIFDYGIDRRPVPSGHGEDVLHFYVMEFLKGRSLSRTLREDGALSVPRAVDIARSIAEALGLSHEAGVIHRDIKPSNIFLRARGEAVLLDFGIAKSGSVALTRQGQILGTPSYLAPERLREKELPIDGRADLFSLGVLLFTMIKGSAPFVGDDVYEVIDQIAKAEPPELEASTPGTEALKAVTDRLLAKSPQDRFQDAESVVEVLRKVEALLVEEAVAVRPPPPALPVMETETAVDVRRGPTAPPVTESEAEAEAEDEGEVTGPDVETLADEAEPSDFEAVETAVHPAPEPVQATRPELALMRQTREVVRDPEAVEAPEIGSGTWSGDDTFSDEADGDEETLAETPEERASRQQGEAVLTSGARIEVSLVDEDDVVVRPIPSDGDDEEAATHAGASPRASQAVIATEEVSRSPRPGTPPRAHRPLAPPAGRKLELEEGLEVLPAEGATVDRRTFGVKASQPGKPKVSVRMTEARSRRERWTQPAARIGALLAAIAVSVSLGLTLGRWGRSDPVAADEPSGSVPALAPAIVAVAPSGGSEAKKSAKALLSDAEAARTANLLQRAEAAYAAAAKRARSKGDPALEARAHLGRADVLRGLGQERRAATAYRAVLSATPNGPSANQARMALRELGIGRPRSAPPSAAKPPPSSPPPVVRAPKRPKRTPEAACRELLFRFASDPEAAVQAFEKLAFESPRAPCARWNLGVKYERVGRPKAAARAYRGYLELVPESARRAAVERRIQSLESR